MSVTVLFPSPELYDDWKGWAEQLVQSLDDAFVEVTKSAYIVDLTSAAAPAYRANLGDRHVTSAGVLYVNTDGANTWAVVGSQT